MSVHYSKDSLREVAGGDEDFMVILAQTFLQEIPLDLAALEEAVENENRELAYQFSHKMKPNLEMFGIEVQKDITNIENWTKSSKKKSSIAGNIENLIEVLTNVFQELKEDFSE
ncbi:Hpt domain-containing protein [Patiriisocius sp. Uisw_017]|uniref:Hpt domain-containing protein n=1 Tax=Patiriisocius sp. Uisw_017 TaxID=3230968 RepID=UPI0039EB7310